MMAYPTSTSRSSSFTFVSLIFCMLVLLSFFTQATVVATGRPVPAAAKAAASDKKLHKESHEEQNGNGNGNGVNVIEAAGVHIGLPSVSVSSVTLPFMSVPSGSEIGDLDHSGPAAANSQYIPGADDTFIPNPGYEVPNPFRGSINIP